MKKIMAVVAASLLACSAISAQSIKLVNTFGGDEDSTGGSDLFSFEKQKDKEGNYDDEYTNTTRASNRLQLDASSEKFDSRLRMEIGTTKLNGKESTVRFRGYGRFKPASQFNLIAGNEFFTKVPVNAGYLAASDDYPKYARILQNGFGAISNWTFGDDGNVTMNVAGGVKGTDESFNDKDKLGLDSGFNFGIKDLVTFGGSFQNMAGNQLSAGVFAAGACVLLVLPHAANERIIAVRMEYTLTVNDEEMLFMLLADSREPQEHLRQLFRMQNERSLFR